MSARGLTLRHTITKLSAPVSKPRVTALMPKHRPEGEAAEEVGASASVIFESSAATATGAGVASAGRLRF